MRRRYSFQVEPAYEGYTLEEYLLKQIPQFDRIFVRKIVHEQLVKVNREEKNLLDRVQTGDDVYFVLPTEMQTDKPNIVKMETLYEDDGVLIVNKPSGVPVIAERWIREKVFKNSLIAYMTSKGDQDPQPRVVHRIDKDASGAVIVAKNRKQEKHLGKLFEERKMEKKYLAVVAGIPPESGTINLPIAQVSPHKNQMMVSEKGKEAITHYSVLEAFVDFSLLEIKIETGRSHQIRVHMASQGFPLAVDAVYGYRDNIKLSDFKSRYQSKKKIEKPLISRLTLHASEISFPSLSGEIICAKAPLSKDFELLLKMLRKYRR